MVPPGRQYIDRCTKSVFSRHFHGNDRWQSIDQFPLATFRAVWQRPHELRNFSISECLDGIHHSEVISQICLAAAILCIDADKLAACDNFRLENPCIPHPAIHIDPAAPHDDDLSPFISWG